MAGGAFTPRVRMMTVCDRVRESDLEAGVFDLKGVRHSIAARVFPFRPRRLLVFMLLSSPRRGLYPGDVIVQNDQDEKKILHKNLSPAPFFEQDNDTLACIAPARCTFPEPGQYSFQIWFFQEHGSDILRGEYTFQVIEEGW